MEDSATRLSDEELDPMEYTDTTVGEVSHHGVDTDSLDLRRALSTMPTTKSRLVISTYLAKGNRHDIGFTEKAWRYHFGVGFKHLKEYMNE